LKATLAQTTQNQPSSLLIIMKKSPVIIVTGNNILTIQAAVSTIRGGKMTVRLKWRKFRGVR
jgi:hypothetical protein